MEKIFILGSYTFKGKILASKKEASFSVPVSDKQVVDVKLVPDENLIEALEEVDVSDELFKVLGSEGRVKISPAQESELVGFSHNISLAVRKVMNLLKYCFNQYEIEEAALASKGTFWSQDKADWAKYPRKLHSSMSIINMLKLDEERCKLLQEYIDSDFQPFLALRHLHRARAESVPRYKWIEATIAAELAIKEFLIRYKPDLEVLLLELPSPPLDKMYKRVLKEYAEPLPKEIVNGLKKGAEIRNQLLHRPELEKIDSQIAINYVNVVSEAIGHLLSILYPKHRLVV